MKVDFLNLKKEYGETYAIKIDEAYKLEKPKLRDSVESYYLIPAKHGLFYPYGGNTIAFYCMANRIKKVILQLFRDRVTLFS
jgi:hypothetical protein